MAIDWNVCWEARRAVNSKGYATMGWQGKTVLVHRWAYEKWVGPIPPGLTIDHLCRNKKCYNPAHLEAVTSRENTLRSDSPPARNARKTHCVHGQAFDDANTITRKDGRRRCRACTYQATQAWAKSKRAEKMVRKPKHAAASAAQSKNVLDNFEGAGVY